MSGKGAQTEASSSHAQRAHARSVLTGCAVIADGGAMPFRAPATSPAVI